MHLHLQEEEPPADLAEKRAVGCVHGGGQGQEEQPCAQHPGLAGGAVDETVDSVGQHCRREKFIQCKN